MRRAILACTLTAACAGLLSPPAPAQWSYPGLDPELKIEEVVAKARRAGQKRVKILGFRLSNAGGFSASQVKACVSLSSGYKVTSRPSGSSGSGRKICFAPVDIEGGKAAAFKVVGTVPGRAGSFSAKITASASNAPSAKHKAQLTVVE